MPTELTLIFNDYTLPGVEDWSEDQPTRLAPSKVLLMDGEADEEKPNIDPRIISVTGKLYAANYSALRTLYDELAYNVNYGRAQLEIDGERFIWATKQDLQKRFYTCMRGSALEYSLSFRCADPYWYALTATEVTATITTSPQTVTVTPAGLQNTPPVLSLTPSGTMTMVRFLNNHDLSQIWAQYDGSVSAGNTLQIDCGEKTVLNGATDELGKMTGDFFDLFGNSANPLIITGTGNAGALTITYRNRWL